MPPGRETVRVPDTEQLRMRSCSPSAQLRADLLEGLCPCQSSSEAGLPPALLLATGVPSMPRPPSSALGDSVGFPQQRGV